MEAACEKAGRDPGEVTIIAATKYTDPEGVKLISELGIDNFGENRADELLQKKENSLTGIRGYMPKSIRGTVKRLPSA